MNATLREVWNQHGRKRYAHKWNHYLDVYEKHCSHFVGTDVHVLEVGVAQGGSLQLWKSYFGPKARIFGIDINPDCKNVEEENIKVFLGDQADEKFLGSVFNKIQRIDVLIDDGGHFSYQQTATLKKLFPRISIGGVYSCEDTYTSWWEKFNPAGQQDRTFMQEIERLVHPVNNHGIANRHKPSPFIESISSVHIYPAIVIIEKQCLDLRKISIGKRYDLRSK